MWWFFFSFLSVILWIACAVYDARRRKAGTFSEQFMKSINSGNKMFLFVVLLLGPIGFVLLAISTLVAIGID